MKNSHDKVSTLKLELSYLRTGESKFKNKIKNLENKLSILDTKTKVENVSVSCQTTSMMDTPYLLSEELPPIFSSKLCSITKPTIMYNSVPNLSTLIMVEQSEETMLRDAAEDALSEQYDLEISKYYEEARIRAAAIRQIYDDNAIEMLFQSNG